MKPWDKFTVGFWHPFGPHGGETSCAILERKKREIVDTCDIRGRHYTLWSFQYRRPETLETWRKTLREVPDGEVLAFCSDSPGAKDAKGSVTRCSLFQNELGTWETIPMTISVPHPLGARSQATAFVVSEVISMDTSDIPILSVSWLSKIGWRNDRLPTRGEYLLRKDGRTGLRRVCAVLKLKAPYVVAIKPA